MLPIFPSTEIINFLQVRKDEYNNNEGWCSLRGWVSLTNKPEEEIRIYLLLLLQESFPDLIFTAESNRLDVSCFCKHPHELQNFNYHIRPLLIWEVKRIDGSSFENTRTQMELYIKEHQLPFGALFYNALEMVFLSCQGETIRIETIENLKELIDKLRDNLSLALKEIYDLFLTASKFGNSAFDAIIKRLTSSNNTIMATKMAAPHHGRPYNPQNLVAVAMAAPQHGRPYVKKSNCCT